MSPTPPGGGGQSLICPIRVCAAEQDMAFRVFNRYTILLLSVLNRVRSFWTGSLSKSVKTCDERSTFEIPIIVFLNIYFHDFSVKNYLILYAKHKKSGSESSVSCLKQASEMSNFCLKQGRSLKASEAQLYPDFPWVPPPGGPTSVACSRPMKGIRIPETAGNFCLWHPESWALESGRQLKESGISLTIGIRNPNFTDKESRIQCMKSGIHAMESRI